MDKLEPTETDHPQTEVWRRRLAELHEWIAAQSEPAWLYESRSRVLRYLLSRYGSAQHRVSIIPDSARPRTTHTFSSPTLIDCNNPPKSPAVIRALLEDIHRSVKGL